MTTDGSRYSGAATRLGISVEEYLGKRAAGLRLERMKGRHNGIIRELSEAERGREADRVARLEAEAVELARAINDMERSK